MLVSTRRYDLVQIVLWAYLFCKRKRIGPNAIRNNPFLLENMKEILEEIRDEMADAKHSLRNIESNIKIITAIIIGGCVALLLMNW